MPKHLVELPMKQERLEHAWVLVYDGPNAEEWGGRRVFFMVDGEAERYGLPEYQRHSPFHGVSLLAGDLQRFMEEAVRTGGPVTGSIRIENWSRAQLDAVDWVGPDDWDFEEE